MHLVYSPQNFNCRTVVFLFSWNNFKQWLCKILEGKQGALWSMWKWWIEPKIKLRLTHYQTSFTFVVCPASSTLFKASIIMTVRCPASVIRFTVSVSSRIRSRILSESDSTVGCSSPVFSFSNSRSSSTSRFNIFRGTKKVQSCSSWPVT